ncbi:unnamed protein product, partial [Ectocarpus fasciculatus]
LAAVQQRQVAQQRAMPTAVVPPSSGAVAAHSGVPTAPVTSCAPTHPSGGARAASLALGESSSANAAANAGDSTRCKAVGSRGAAASTGKGGVEPWDEDEQDGGTAYGGGGGGQGRVAVGGGCKAVGSRGAAVSTGKGGVEPWDEDEQDGGTACGGGGGGQGRAAVGGGGGGEVVDPWVTSPLGVLTAGDREDIAYEVKEKAAGTGEDTVVLLLRQTEGLPEPLVGVEFSPLRLSVSFECRDDAILTLASLLYLHPLKYRVLSSKPPYTMGYTSVVPAPFVVSAASHGPFGEA